MEGKTQIRQYLLAMGLGCYNYVVSNKNELLHTTNHGNIYEI